MARVRVCARTGKDGRVELLKDLKMKANTSCAAAAERWSEEEKERRASESRSTHVTLNPLFVV